MAEDNVPMEEDDAISPCDRTLDLIGDGTLPFALPTLSKIKHDLFKRIDAATLVKLMDGGFSDIIESFTIVDCRYPYEYHGGHIKHSLNIHNESDLVKLFLDRKKLKQAKTNSSKRRIIIFHCEFSSQRGPNLLMTLREKDREINHYPELVHPELYLLEGGYKDFYKNYKEYCEPQAYKPMSSRNYREELINFRTRRKKSNPRRKENRTPDISFEGG